MGAGYFDFSTSRPKSAKLCDCGWDVILPAKMYIEWDNHFFFQESKQIAPNVTKFYILRTFGEIQTPAVNCGIPLDSAL